ncbi:hypothetical protein MWU57_13880 [Isoptericola sp. S6320L]|uniref:hypothetical protein n=1 Tax=Isoptericola sp. S6320L TaxID=2926411 RepID=UPI001FF4CF66|nr:hypothetical protein [Isoptericola sp. S6320L]MCK0118123.1 hypothetical protein [Isoptericola sp. S6320L]
MTPSDETPHRDTTAPASPGTPDRPDAPRTGRRGPRRAVRRGSERETVWGATTDDEGGHDSNDERLRRDVPPHW